MLRTSTRRPPWTALWFVLLALFAAVAQSQNTNANSSLTLTLTRRTGGALYVQWEAANGNDNISDYSVFVNGSLVSNVSSWGTSFSAYGLVPNTLYNVTVQGNLIAADANGSLAITSNALLIKTLNATNPDPPIDVGLVAAGGGFLRVRVALAPDTGGTNISTILLSVRSQVDFTTWSYSNVASEPEFTVYGLTAKTMYRLRAYVVNDAQLYSSQSYALYHQTVEVQNPGPCPAPTVLNVTGGSIAVRLNPPVDSGGAAITGYVVFMAVNGSGVFEEVVNTITYDQFDAVDIRRLPGQPTKPLTPRTQYDIKAIAVNLGDMCLNPSHVGNLTGNVTTVWTTDASLPEPPPAPYFLSASGGHVSIQVLMPGNMRGANLTGFSVMLNGSVYGSVAASDEQSFDIMPLASLSNYSVQVAVTTDMGVSDWSPEVIVSTSSPSAPAPPGNVSVTAISSSQATISWAPPWNSGGAAITDYRLIVLSSRVSQTLLTGGARTYQLNTLLAASAYTVKVVAINSAGRESTTTRIPGVTFQTLFSTSPSEPRGVRSVSSTGGVLEIAWQVPEASGGVQFEDLLYNATIFPVGSCFNSSSNQSACHTCNLVRVPASNEQYNLTFGEGICVQPSIPACPDGTSACCVTTSNSSFDSGLLCSRITGHGRSRVVSGGSTMTSFEGLNHSSTYYVGVEAINALGKSETSPIVALKTRMQTAPGYPSNIRQINATGGSIVLSWSPPLDTGGTAIIGYNVYRDYRRLTPSPVFPPFADCGLIANSQYVYGISAVNGSRLEGAMGSILVTTPQVTLPNPITLSVAARTVSWMNVTVSTGCDTSGSSALSYQYVIRESGTVVSSGFFPCCSFLIPGLEAGLYYDVSVRVANEAGLLDWVTATLSTTTGIPSAPQWQLQRSNSFSLVFSTMSATNPDREIVLYEVVTSRGSAVIHDETIYCDTFIGSGQRSCPELYRVSGLSPRTDYNLSIRAIGVRGASGWSMGNFSTSDEPVGAFKIATQDYSSSSGETVMITVQRVNGTAGPANITIDVMQPDTVVLRCECQDAIGCACGLFLRVSGTLSVPGVLQFLDGQENQTVQVTIWEDDNAAPQSMAVLLNLIGANVVSGTPSQALIRVTPSQRAGFPCFIRSKSEVAENTPQLKVNVIRVKGSSGPIAFDVETFDISSTAFMHYLPLSTTVTMSDRQSVASFSIQLIDNSYYDGTRVFGIRLRYRNSTSTARATSQLSVITRRVVIIDDEDPSMILPARPQGVQLVRVTGGELEYSWQQSNASNTSVAAVGGYIVRASTPSNGPEVFSMFNISALPSFILSSLQSKTLYRVQVAAWNAYGMSEFSDTFFAMTSVPTPPSEPEDFRALTAGSSVLTLGWSPPRDTGGEDVTGYMIWSRWEDSIFRQVVNLSLPVTTYSVEGLNALTQYEFLIAASTETFLATLDGSSAHLVARTSDPTVVAKPPPPELMRPATGGSLTFLIREPTDLGGLPISDYSLYLRKSPTFDDDGVAVSGGVPADEPFRVVCSDATPWANDSSARSCTAYKLLASTSYEAYVVLHNDVGTSPPSDHVNLRTKSTMDLPSPPENFGPSRITAGNIYLTWDPPIDLGGAADVLGYTVFQKTDVYFSNDFFTVYDGRDSTDRQLALKGLRRSTKYAFAIVAQNAASYCVNLAAQQMTEFIIVTTLPYSQISPPQSLRQLSASGGMIVIVWDDPDDLAGDYLMGYTVELIVDGDGVNAQAVTLGTRYGNTKTFSHSGLTELTTYRYSVRAFNQDGPSNRSDIISVTTTACTAPTSVLNAQFLGGTGGHVAISWQPPEDTGGRPILYYQVTRTDRTDLVYTTASLSFTDSNGIMARSQYAYMIRAFNELYMGDNSYVWGFAGDPTVPESAVLAGVTSFGGRLDVNWTSPQDTGGIPIVAFVVTLLDSTGETVIESYRGMEATHTFTALNATSAYMLSLQAVNDIGPGPAGQYNVYTGPVDLPSAPPAPTASEILGGSIRLTVYPPSYNGGDLVTLSLHNGSSIVYTFAEGETSVAVKNLVALTTYHFHVIASNARGNTSGDVLVVSTGDITQPSIVESIQLIGASFDRLTVAWPVVQDSGGDVLLQYVVSYFQSDGTGTALSTNQVAQVTTPSLNATLLRLEHTSYYAVAVYAVTSSGLRGDSTPTAVFMTEEPLQGRITAQYAEMTVREDAVVASVQVLRVEGSFGEITYSFETVDESAVAGTNYAAASGTLTMASGVKTGTIDVVLSNDANYEPNTTFIVLITDGPTQRQNQTRVVLLDDGDAGFISFAQSQFAFPENAGTVYLPITRYGGSSPPATIEVFVLATRAAQDDRFTLPEQIITFNEGDAEHDLAIVIEDDSTFQFWPDSLTLGFRILLGGVWAGEHTVANVTALDDGDVSPAKEITNLKLIAATGGSVQLQWSPPVDRGGTDVELSYSLGFSVEQDAILNMTTVTNAVVVYNLNASTTYQVVVFTVNPAGLGLGSILALISTTKATPPSAPLNVNVIAASSSSLLLRWDAPLDAGGSPVIGYKIYNVFSNGSIAPFPAVSCSTPNVCSIQRLVALTYYPIQVRAFTAAVSTGGELSDITGFQTSNPDVPDPPPDANVTWFSAGAITVKMFKPVNVGGSDVELYRLFIRGPFDDGFTEQYEGGSDTFSVYRLARRTTYEIRYQVINSVGASAYGASIFQQTLERSLPSAPLSLMSISATGGSIQLSWQEPLDVGGRPISGYAVFIKPQSQTNATAAVADTVGYDGKGNPATWGIVYGLNASTTYSMYVIAYSEVSNCYSPTELAASDIAQLTTTVPTLPVPAPTLLLVRYTGGIVELMWTPPTDAGGVPIDSYTLSLVSPTGTIPIFTTPGSSRLSFIHNDLIESTVYTYMVKANTSVGDSPMSDPVVVKTLIATAPSAPLDIRQLTYVTGGAIQIAWTRPIDTGGQPLKGYWVYRDGVPVAQNLPAFTSNFTDKQNLRAATSYQYTIRTYSWSTMGSELSAPLTAKTAAATKPQLPLLITNFTGASFIQVNWAADPDTGGMPVSLFDVKLLQGAAVVGAYTGADSSYRFTRLLALNTYTLQVVAYSQIGASDTLSVEFTTLNVTLPAPPVAPLALSVFGGNMTIEVSAPEDTGGAPVSALRLYEATLGLVGNASLVAGALKAQFPVYGVLKLTSYMITATAVNVLGEGGSSPVLTVMTGKASLPGSIRTAPTLTGATGSTLSVTWTAPVDTGGDATLSYEVRFVEVGTTTSIVSLSATRALQGTGLKFLTSYSISVRAINTAGKSDWSPSVIGKTLPDAAGEFNFAVTAINVSESAGGVTLTVTRTNGLSGSVAIAFSVSSSGSNAATIAKDYALVSGSTKSSATITFSALQTSASMPILIVNDDVYEAPDEQFTVQLISATVVGASLVIAPSIGVNSTAVVTILDDGDAGYVGFAYQYYPVREDGVWLDIPILRQGGKSGLIVLSVILADGTATGDRDYRRAPGLTVSMVDGQTNSSVRVFIINDKTFEYPDETFTVQVVPVSGGALLRHPLTTVVIIDDGDVSVAAAPSTPVVQAMTGGAVTLGIGLPAHNGSAKGQLTGYVVRILNPATSDQFFNTTVALGSTATVGWLQAQTSYGASVAAINSVGLGPFSAPVWFTTTVPTLPAAVMAISQTGSTGGSISLNWAAPTDTGGVPITKYRVYYISSKNVPKLILEIPFPLLKGYVLGLNALTTYRFAVQAGNDVLVPELAHGWGVIGPPFSFSTPAPTLAAATTISKDPYMPSTGGSITIQWTPPIDTGGVPLLRYDIYARNATTGFRLAAQAMQPASSVRIEELYASSWYEIFVLSINQVPESTLPGLFSCSRGSKSLVTSHDVSKNVSSGAVIRAANGVFVVGDMTLATKGTLPLTAAYMDSSVVKVSASVMGVATSFANLSTTPPSIPRVPPMVTLINATGGALSFRVDSPGDTGGVPIDAFTVLVNGAVPEDTDIQVRSNMTSLLKRSQVMRVSNLEPMTDHTITAVAVNSISLCDFNKKDTSEPAVFQTTNITQPEPPQIATQSVSGGGMVLALIDPFDKGGSSISRYQLYMATDLAKEDWKLIHVGYGANDSTVTRQSATVAGLKPLIKYFFKLSVNNGYFESSNSSVATIATSNISPPGQCTQPRLVDASGGMLSIAWDDPLDNGGAPVIDFVITLQAARVGASAAASKRTINSWTARTYTFYGLTDETDYVIAVRARNSKGLGVDGVAATLSTTDGSPPLGAINVTVLSSTGGAAIIAFNEPIDFGGTPRENMVYSVFVEGVFVRTLTFADVAAAVASSTKSRRLASVNGISVGGLDPLGLYGIQIQPVNDFDSGNVSKVSLAATTAPTLPSAPQALTASTVTGGSIQLTWQPPPGDTGGLPLAGYTVYMGLQSTGTFTIQCVDTITECRVSSLTAATTYWFYATARNSLGESPPSAVINVATASISIPSAPGKTRVVSVSENAVEASWFPPLDTGGATISTYTVTVSDLTQGGTLTPLTTSVPNVSITGLSPTTEYSITVTATNQLQRTSSESLPLLVVTASAAYTPAEPIVSCVSPTTVSLSWYPYPGATAYRVYQDGTQVYSGTATDMVDNGLTSGTDYSYTLEAQVGGAWSGTTSLPVVAHTSDDASSTETTCSSSRGYIHETNYAPNIDKSWLLTPTSVFGTLTIEFTSFDLECDHDTLSIENADDDSPLWRGGCQRSGNFIFQSKTAVRLRLHSDASVEKGGFELYFETDRLRVEDSPTRIPVPQGAGGAVCSGHGLRQNNGDCKCSVGFTGEACNNYIVCCADAARCSNPICALDSSRVIVVSDEFGDDLRGTGEMMDTGDKGTASKAVKSLSKALSLAKDGDFVFVYPGEYKGTWNRELQVNARNDLTIMSLKGFAWTTINCQGAGRAMQLTSSSVAVQGLTIRNGLTTTADSDGGSILATDSVLTLQNVLVTQSSATRSGGAIAGIGSNITAIATSVEKSTAPSGGGMSLTDSKLSLSQSNVTSCTATNGAGLLADGSSAVSGAIGAMISKNVASGGGGGVLVRTGSLSLKSLTMIANEAARGGGVLAQDGSSIVAEGCRVAQNKASIEGGGMAIVGSVSVGGNASTFDENVAVGGGGGVHVRGQQVSIAFVVTDDLGIQAQLKNNRAANGSGLYVVDSTLVLSGLTIANGTASENGGGLCVDASRVTLTNVSVSSNSAASMGGGMFAADSEIISQGAVTLELNNASIHGGGLFLMSTNVGGDVRLRHNIATQRGGGFHVNGTSTLVNVTVEECSADQGGGGYLQRATVAATSVNITSSTATTSGGGLHMNGSTLSVVQSVIDRGSANFGGGVYAVNGSSISGDLVISWSIASESGGALYATDQLTLANIVAINSTAKRGAGLFTELADVVVTNVTVSSCYATLAGGGWSAVASSLVLTDVRLEGSTSDEFGGAMALVNCSVTHNNATVVSNQAKIGGGLYLVASNFTGTPLSSEATAYTSTIRSNTAKDHGGNVYAEDKVTMSALLITGGSSGTSGGGVAMRQAAATISQCVIQGNSADVRGGGLSLRDQSSCDLGISIVNQNLAKTFGGAVSIEDSVFTHNNLELHENRALNGGGFAVAGVSGIRQFVGSDGSLLNASVAMQLPDVMGNGSAFYVSPRSVVDIAGLYVYQGLAATGGLFVDTATVAMERCQFVYNNADTGGALFANPLSVVNVVSSQFYSNRASLSGGAVQLMGNTDDDSVASFEDCEFADNYAEKVGGAVGVAFADLTLLRTRFQTNTIGSKDGGGGAIGATMQGTLNITDCTFGNNTVQSEDAKGGSLYLLTDTNATITRTALISDESSILVREGGVVYIGGKGSHVSIADCEIAYGQSYSGGSIFVLEATLSLVRTVLREGYAYEFGGSVYMDSAVAEMVDCDINDNDAFYDGGGIYLKGKSTLTLRNTTIENNRVQDGGAGLYVAPGGGASVSIFDSSFVMNRNRGLGSAIYVGRKNTLTMTSSELLGNGGVNTEGGGLYAVDAKVTVSLSTFLGNRAVRGAAIELARDALLTMANSDFADNQATVWGGAIYMSVRAIATIEDSSFRNNSAVTGGVAYLLGSSKLMLRRSNVTANIALSFGGAVTLMGRARAEIDRTVLALNRAYTGGALSITQNAALLLTSTELSGNTANDFGGAMYIDTLETTASQSIKVQSVSTRDNTARAGADVYWVYHAWYEFVCGSCASSTSSSGKIRVATSPASITAGWWPDIVTSGVSLGITKPSWKSPDATAPAPNPSSSNTTAAPSTSPGAGVAVGGIPPASPAPGNRRLTASSSSSSSSDSTGTLDAATLTSIIANPDLTSPFEATLWPTILVKDFYGALADQDNRTRCVATKLLSETDYFDFYPASPIDVDRGYVTFADAQILSESRPTPFRVFVSCSLADDTARNLTVQIVVENCNPGYENVEGRCVPCKKGTYSLDGVKCHLCPLGAMCERMDATKTVIGVSVPTRLEGYFLYASRDSYLDANCLDASKWEDGDPCKRLVNVSELVTRNMTYRLQHCSKNPTFDKYWPRKRVFACLAGLEYYACDTRDACIAEGASTSSTTTTVQAMSTSVQAPSLATSTTAVQCDVGYNSVTCATCISSYYKVSNGKCKPCSDAHDPAVERMTRLVALVPVGFAVIAAILVWFYFSNSAEQEIMKQARAARKFQIYDPHSRPQSLLLAAKFFVQQRVAEMMQRARENLERRHRGQNLFGIERRKVTIPAFRAEKFKILLAFFQIFGGFKKLYEIPWPNEMSRLMDIFSIADFSLVDTTGIECFIHKDYFSNYRLSLVAVLVLLFMTTLLLSWGVVRYRVKLAGLPRHCVQCGLPVFQMLRRQPKTLVRRSTMVSMLRIERKMHAERMRRRSFGSRAKDTVLNKTDELLSRAKSWWASTRLGKTLDRFIVFTRLPASCSEHNPSCPTSQQIESEVLAMVVRSNLRLWRARIRLRLNYQSFQNKCIKLFFWILLLFYPELSQRVVGMFYCDEIGSDFYMSRDKSQLCYQGTWLYYLPLTMFLLVVWVAGVPLLFWTIIFVKRRSGVEDQLLLLQDSSHTQLKQRFLKEMHEDLVERGVHVDPDRFKTFEKEMLAEFLRNKKLNEPSMVAQVGFIYHSYRSQFWWFEVWDLCRKLFLNCVIGLLAKTGANRIIAGLIVFLIYLSVMLFYQPYKDRSDSALAGVTQIQLFITLFCGLMLKMGALHMEDSVVSLLTYVAFFSNVITMIYAFCSILYEKFDGARRARRRAREDHRRAIQSHVRKLWRRAYGYAFTEVYLRDPSIRPMPVQVFLELARRDREARMEREMELQLARSLHVRDNDDDDDQVSSSQVEFELPRPRDVVSPRAASSLSSSASFKQEKEADEPSRHEEDTAGDAGKIDVNEDNQTHELTHEEESQQLGHEGGDDAAGAVDT